MAQNDLSVQENIIILREGKALEKTLKMFITMNHSLLIGANVSYMSHPIISLTFINSDGCLFSVLGYKSKPLIFQTINH